MIGVAIVVLGCCVAFVGSLAHGYRQEQRTKGSLSDGVMLWVIFSFIGLVLLTPILAIFVIVDAFV